MRPEGDAGVGMGARRSAPVGSLTSDPGSLEGAKAGCCYRRSSGTEEGSSPSNSPWGECPGLQGYGPVTGLRARRGRKKPRLRACGGRETLGLRSGARGVPLQLTRSGHWIPSTATAGLHCWMAWKPMMGAPPPPPADSLSTWARLLRFGRTTREHGGVKGWQGLPGGYTQALPGTGDPRLSTVVNVATVRQRSALRPLEAG